VQSLAGGTGSGLGAHLVETLRDDYPGSNILNFSVWPYLNGEVVLQNYNVLLTLGSLIENSDAVITLFNDQILTICKELLKNARPSYKVLNQVIA
jgi:tubulin delta